jgi:hypothetical protein
MAALIWFRWTGDAMEPLPRCMKLCDDHFIIGETYSLAPVAERSRASHNHFFAMLTEAWQTLPERLSGDFPTPEHLRKRALIMTGHYDAHSTVCASAAEAARLAAFARPIDEFSVITVDGLIVTHARAKSQSVRAMGKADFQKSKDDVLTYASMLGCFEASDLGKSA